MLKQTMENNLFSLLLTNLFVGLCKSSRRLRPYSDEFSKSLGYQIFKFEPSFALLSANGERCNPDLILMSKIVSNTLITEWTQASNLGEGKKKQIATYAKIQVSDIVNMAGVPSAVAQNFSVVFVVKPNVLSEISDHLSKNSWRMPILSLSQDNNEYTLAKVGNGSLETRTDAFFTKGVKFKQIPEGYLKFSLDAINESNITDSITRHLVSLIVKGVGEITTEQFCVGFVKIWGYLSQEKQREIVKRTGEILKEMTRNEKTRPLLLRIKDNPSTWQVIDKKTFFERMRSYQTALDEFRFKKEGKGEFQPSLFDSET
jgi:hypothetical protein